MTATPHLHAYTSTQISRVLQSAVILSWDELIPRDTSGSVHIEYGTGAAGAIDFLKILSSTTRGHWNLVCEYWATSKWDHSVGMTFGTVPCPPRVALSIETLVQHQGEFAALNGASPNGIIQVFCPTAEERSQAADCIAEAFDHLGYKPPQRGMEA